MKPAGQPEQAVCAEYTKSCVLCMLVCKFVLRQEPSLVFVN